MYGVADTLYPPARLCCHLPCRERWNGEEDFSHHLWRSCWFCFSATRISKASRAEQSALTEAIGPIKLLQLCRLGAVQWLCWRFWLVMEQWQTVGVERMNAGSQFELETYIASGLEISIHCCTWNKEGFSL